MLAAVFLLAQVVVGYAGWLTPRHEIFPFTSWLLFSLVPGKVTDYDLILHGSSRWPQVPPRPFNQSGGLVSSGHSIVTYQVIQQLGAAVTAGDTARIESLRHQIEEQFAVPSIRYDLVNLTYQPVARWKTGQILSSRVVQSFVAYPLLPSAPKATPTPESVLDQP